MLSYPTVPMGKNKKYGQFSSKLLVICKENGPTYIKYTQTARSLPTSASSCHAQ